MKELSSTATVEVNYIFSISKKASELGEICLDYIKIHEDLSLERHKLLRTYHKQLSLARLRHVLHAF